jgi:hypothetical protein
MVPSSLLVVRWAAVIEATGTRFEQSHGAATDDTLETFPRTLALPGSALTSKALPSTVNVAPPPSVPPRCRSPRTTLGLDEVTLPGVQRLPPMLEAVDHDTPVLAPTLPPRPPSGEGMPRSPLKFA